MSPKSLINKKWQILNLTLFLSYDYSFIHHIIIFIFIFSFIVSHCGWFSAKYTLWIPMFLQNTTGSTSCLMQIGYYGSCPAIHHRRYFHIFTWCEQLKCSLLIGFFSHFLLFYLKFLPCVKFVLILFNNATGDGRMQEDTLSTM